MSRYDNAAMDWRDERLQELLRAGKRYDEAERIIREEALELKKQRRREQRGKRAAADPMGRMPARDTVEEPSHLGAEDR
jgi:hypothetical protein